MEYLKIWGDDEDYITYYPTILHHLNGKDYVETDDIEHAFGNALIIFSDGTIIKTEWIDKDDMCYRSFELQKRGDKFVEIVPNMQTGETEYSDLVKMDISVNWFVLGNQIDAFHIKK